VARTIARARCPRRRRRISIHRRSSLLSRESRRASPLLLPLPLPLLLSLSLSLSHPTANSRSERTLPSGRTDISPFSSPASGGCAALAASSGASYGGRERTGANRGANESAMPQGRALFFSPRLISRRLASPRDATSESESDASLFSRSYLDFAFLALAWKSHHERVPVPSLIRVSRLTRRALFSFFEIRSIAVAWPTRRLFLEARQRSPPNPPILACARARARDRSRPRRVDDASST